MKLRVGKRIPIVQGACRSQRCARVGKVKIAWIYEMPNCWEADLGFQRLTGPTLKNIIEQIEELLES